MGGGFLFALCLIVHLMIEFDGLVIIFIDINVAKKLETELNKTIDILRKHNLYKL
jgi:hypothetical protein